MNVDPGSAGIPAGQNAGVGGVAGKDAGAPRDGKGWYSRGYLPHLDEPERLQSINFRLHDALPAEVVERWKHELRWREGLAASDPAVVTLRQRIAEYEDAGYGACWLRSEGIAALVEDTLLHFDSARYRLLAWCIMPNHVHALIETWPGHPLGRVLHSWKSFSAQRANEMLRRKGPFWAREYYDRFIRDEGHLTRAIAYIEGNPVKAGLAKSAEAWRFGSAARRAEGRMAGDGAATDGGAPGGACGVHCSVP